MQPTPSPPPQMPGRLKSGLIFALVSFVVGAAGGFLASVCMLPVAAILGAAAGWVGARWEAPPTRERARRDGLLAGLLAGVGGGLGTLSGGLLANLWASSWVLGFLEQQTGTPLSPSIFWASALLTTSCVAGTGAAAAAAFGALGGLAWYDRQGVGVEGVAVVPGGGRNALLWMAGLLALLVCCVAGFILVSWLALFGMGGSGFGL